MAALLAAVLAGLIPAEDAFMGFGHPAVITVAAVLAMTRALTLSGVIDRAASQIAQRAQGPALQIAGLSALACAMSAFMNNVGALALVMPVAISTARKFKYSPSLILMPLAFASILGGLVTLIGTPPNLIVSAFRRDFLGEPFRMFDFTPVGLPVAAAGLLYLILVGWRLVPHRSGAQATTHEPGDYVAELRVREESSLVGKSVGEAEAKLEVEALGLVRGDRRVIGDIRPTQLEAGDVLLARVDSATLESLVSAGAVELAPDTQNLTRRAGDETVAVVEAVVLPDRPLDGRTAAGMRLRDRFGVNLLAVARHGRPFRQRLRSVRLQAGDVLLLQGETERLWSALPDLGCLPLAQRGIKMVQGRAYLPLLVFGLAILAIGLGLAPAHVALPIAVLALVLFNLMPLREVYDAIDWPILVLLGAMIPVGGALQTTGATDLVSGALAQLGGEASAYVTLAALLIATMMLTDLLNNAATVVIMAPVGISLAQQLGLNPDPFLIAVAIGGSSAFMTPIGHQNNTLVMGPGGYRFGDYMRIGLPLEALVVAVSVPLIPMVWPF